MIVFLFLACAIIYSITFINYYMGMYRNPISELESSCTAMRISVVIAFRNEGNNLEQLLNSLLKQTDQGFELILINDQSTDDYLPIIGNYEQLFLNFHLLDSEKHIGKKAAIELGVRHAKGELVLTTDGDCILPPTWVSGWKTFFSNNPTIKLAGGIVTLTGISIFEKMQRLEFSSLVASSIGAAKSGNGIMLNAANMAFNKNFYIDVIKDLRREQTPSGDDSFLLAACKKKYSDGFMYIDSNSLIVHTPAVKSINDFIAQRKRWASKTKYYKDKHMKRVAFIVAITNLFLLVGGIGCIFYNPLLLPFLTLLLVKLLVDFLLLYRYLKGIQQLNLLNYFLLVELILPFYIIFVAITSQIGGYTWKDRTYSN